MRNDAAPAVMISRRHSCRVVLAAALLLTSCGRDAERTPTLVLAAASDLAAALPALSSAFEAETGITVTTTVGASGMLARQILNGAPVDVFASADRAWVDRLNAAGRTVPDTRVTYARGSLVLVLAPRFHGMPDALSELSDDAFARIAIANPAHAPYGRAARDALESSGVWAAVESRVVIAENVRQALEYVLSGNVDAALVARALVPGGASWLPVPAELYAPLHQDVIVISGSPRETAARRFVDFLAHGTGRAILRQHNFTLPESAP